MTTSRKIRHLPVGILIRRYQQDDADRAWIAHREATWAQGDHRYLGGCGLNQLRRALREGVAHDRLHLHGQPHDAIVYALLRSRHRPGSG